jgi:long-chain fatty acid transport protein
MKKVILPLIYLGLSCLSGTAHSGGFQLYEQGTPLLGTASVGQAVVDDASSSYFNPANMAHIFDTELQLGSQILSTKIRFRADNANTFTGGNGSDAGTLLAGLGVFGVSSFTDNLTMGFSLTSPFAGVVQYNDGWIGRYFIQSAQLTTLDANLALAYKLNECVSFGMGVFVEYAKLYERIGIPPLFGAPEGQADFRLHSYRPGATLGVLLTPCGESTRIGISYRSPVRHKPKGDVTFLRLAVNPGVSSQLHLPQSVIASISQDITDDFTLLAEAGWSNWSSFQNTSIIINGITLPVIRNWRDTYRFGLGGQFILCENYMLQAGASYDSSPCGVSTRLPDLPVDRQLRYGTGLVYTTLECVSFGLQYEFIDFGKAAIHNATRIGNLSGDYARNFASIVSISVNFKF